VSRLQLFARGAVGSLDPDVEARLLDRRSHDDPGLATTVRSMIEDVRARGDRALVEMSARFDGVELRELEVPRRRWEEARDGLAPEIRAGLERAAGNIRRFHEAQIPGPVSVDIEPGVRVTRAWAPLQRVGVYAPGGRAAYPSSVLMGVVPARSAGVSEVFLCSPPDASGVPSSEVMAAAAIAGADRMFAVGGAGAIAALAYGTESVPAADAIVGPGNRWVTEAKRQVAGEVGIDSPAGPSEVLVLADGTTPPDLAALELLAQAEHDPDAAVVLVADTPETVARVERALDGLVARAPRAEIVRAALATHGALLWATTIDDALRFADRYAPEHASVMTADADAVAARLRNAGTTFVGLHASVAFGDYLTGANHVLPTGGRSRSFSGLSTQHFLRSYTVQHIDEVGAASMAPDVAVLASAEGLPGHAAAALARATSGARPS